MRILMLALVLTTPLVAAAHGDPAARPTVLAADEGEKLLMSGNRHVILKATPKVGAQRLLMGTEYLPAGAAIPVHSHDGYEEVIFIHDGHVRLTVGDEEVHAAPGTTVVIPAGAWHGVAAGDEHSATMLFIFPESRIAEFFRAVGHREGEAPPQLTPEDWARILEEHQMRARR